MRRPWLVILIAPFLAMAFVAVPLSARLASGGAAGFAQLAAGWDWSQAVDVDLPGPLSPVPLDQALVDSTEVAGKASSRRRPRALWVGSWRVLELMNRGVLPSSQAVPATHFRPQGLQVSGVGGMGIGARDGDVLTEVAGQRVQSEGQVIALVLQTHGAGHRAVAGAFWRGMKKWTITVELPREAGTPPR